jgi:hypothetical protein
VYQVGIAYYEITSLYLPWHWQGKQGKGKVIPLQAWSGLEGGKRYSSTLSLPRRYKGVGGQHHAPAALHPGKTRDPLYRRLGGPQGRSGFDPRTVQPVAIRYTDWAIPAHHIDRVTLHFFLLRRG